MSNTHFARIPVELTRAPKARPPEDGYGFGRYFSDHMAVSEWSKGEGWHATRVVPYQPLSLDPGAAVLHYGQALFEGMKAFRGADGKTRLFRPDMNWKRMTDGAVRLCMQAPPQELFMEALLALVRTDASWVPSRENTSLYLRPTLIGTEGFLGVRPSEAYTFFVIGSPVGAYFGEGHESVKIWIERELSRAAPGGIGAVKAGGNYASSLLAAQRARAKGYSQVLWLDAASKELVEEVGTMNIFFKIKGKVLTPALNGSILPGVMRDSCIAWLKSRDYRVEERTVELAEVLTAARAGDLEEAWGTGTAASIAPVGCLATDDGTYAINEGRPGPLAGELYKGFNDLFYGRTRDEMGWMKVVPPADA